MDVNKIIEQYNLNKEIISMRRYIHENPDLSEHESNTMDYICSYLDKWGIEYQNNVAGYGIVATINGDDTGKTVALRGDMDALPIEEETELEFASKKRGVMHACGHDAHVSILLTSAFILNKMKSEIKGTVKLFFQPSEETIGGAKRMIQNGCLDNPRVDYILGLHVEPAYETGKVGIRYGKMYAASDMIDITISGKGAHGAHPDEGTDAIMIAASILNGIQTVVSRNVSPLNSAVVSFGTIKGGAVRNQIADQVKLEGIIRTLDSTTRIFVRERVKLISESIASSMGAEIDFKVMESYGPLINDDYVTNIVKDNAISMLGKNNVILEVNPDLSCEDFSYFAIERPACYFHLGCYSKSNGPHVDLHNPRFTIDENCLMTGVKLQISNIIRLLDKGDTTNE